MLGSTVLLALWITAACGSSAARPTPAAPTPVPLTGPGYAVERASATSQDLRLSGSLSAHVTRARAVCVQLPPPPEAEFSAQILLELKEDRYLLVMAVRPYLGARSYHDSGGGAVISLQPWGASAPVPASRPKRPSTFSVDRSGIAGSVDASTVPFGLGSVAIRGTWHCQPAV